MAFEAPDNGILSYADPRVMQAIVGEITATRIDALFRKWTVRLPPSLHRWGRHERHPP